MKLTGDNLNISIEIKGRKPSNIDDYWESNWLDCQIGVLVNELKAFFRGNITIFEIEKLHSDLETLYETMDSVVEFAPMEEPLYLKFMVTNSGVNVISIFKENGNSNIELKVDGVIAWATLKSFIEDTRRVLSNYPIVGRYPS